MILPKERLKRGTRRCGFQPQESPKLWRSGRKDSKGDRGEVAGEVGGKPK